MGTEQHGWVDGWPDGETERVPKRLQEMGWEVGRSGWET